MKKFDIRDYPLIKTVMHCKTEEEAVAFLEYLHGLGHKWNGGESYRKHTNFDRYGDNTCYEFHQRKFGRLPYFIEEGYDILEFEDFDWGKAFNLEVDEKDKKTISDFLGCFSVSE